MPSIVIVTPVLNGARFINETLSCISNQSDSDWVHYVVDGGSSDGTQEIIRSSMTNEPRRRLIEARDRGMYDAVFNGFDRARADGFGDPASICLWLNSDDLLMPWALAILRAGFARSGADWMTSLPGFWDVEGRLQMILPYAWYPRALIRLGLFQDGALGFIQQESSFFTRKLLDTVSAETIEAIRSSRLAGDFMLWRAFARTTGPLPLPMPLSGFRGHGANASVTQMDRYYAEMAASGARIVPRPLGRVLRWLFRPFALLKAYNTFRQRSESFTRGEY